MTVEERLAALGVETRDFVPSDEHCKNLYDKFYAEAKRICKLMGGKLDGPFMVSLLLVAVAKRDIIIDRMETRLNNVIGERDYLARQDLEYCGDCVHWDNKNDECILIRNGDRSGEGNCFLDGVQEFAGIHEEWSVDDA